VVIAAVQPAIGHQLVSVRLGHEPFGYEGLQHLGEREAVIRTASAAACMAGNIASRRGTGKHFDFAAQLRDASRFSKTRDCGDLK